VDPRFKKWLIIIGLGIGLYYAYKHGMLASLTSKIGSKTGGSGG